MAGRLAGNERSNMVPKFVLLWGGNVGVLILGWLSVCVMRGVWFQAVLIPFCVYIIHASYLGIPFTGTP